MGLDGPAICCGGMRADEVRMADAADALRGRGPESLGNRVAARDPGRHGGRSAQSRHGHEAGRGDAVQTRRTAAIRAHGREVGRAGQTSGSKEAVGPAPIRVQTRERFDGPVGGPAHRTPVRQARSDFGRIRCVLRCGPGKWPALRWFRFRNRAGKRTGRSPWEATSAPRAPGSGIAVRTPPRPTTPSGASGAVAAWQTGLGASQCWGLPRTSHFLDSRGPERPPDSSLETAMKAGPTARKRCAGGTRRSDERGERCQS